MTFFYHLISLVTLIGHMSDSAIPRGRRSAPLVSRIDHNNCEYYGISEASGAIWNVYTIDLAGWGNNDGDATGECGGALSLRLQLDCERYQGWECEEVRENPHDTRVTFMMPKMSEDQPECIARAVREALPEDQRAKVGDFHCRCLGDCWSGETIESA